MEKLQLHTTTETLLQPFVHMYTCSHVYKKKRKKKKNVPELREKPPWTWPSAFIGPRRNQRVAILRRRFPTTVAGALRVLRRGVESAPVVQGSTAEAPLPSTVAGRGGPRASHSSSPGARSGRLSWLPRPFPGQQRTRLTQVSFLPGPPWVHIPVVTVQPRLRLQLL